jgi:DNA helicase HerA-like ATPase
VTAEAPARTLLMHEEELVDEDAVFRVGRVVAVNGRHVRIAVDKQKNSSHLLFRGNVVRNVAVAGFVKIIKGFVEIIARVDGEYVSEDRSASQGYRRGADTVARQLDVSLVGFLSGGAFQRGIREMPLLDNECFVLTEREYDLVHTFVPSGEAAISIGSLAAEPTQPVVIGVDAIFASHVGIFGNTGSGKSYTLAKLYHELFSVFVQQPGFRERARFVIVDFNGEYIDRHDPADAYGTAVITDRANKKEFVLSTRGAGSAKLPLPNSVVEDPAFWTILLNATEKTQAPFVKRALESTYWADRLSDPERLMQAVADLVDRATKSTDIATDAQTVMNLLGEIQTCVDASPDSELAALISDFRDNLHFNSTLRKYYWGPWSSYSPMTPDNQEWASYTSDRVRQTTIDVSSIQPGIDLIRFKIVLQYYREIISGFSNREHLSPLIKRMETRVPDVKKVIVIDESGAFATEPLAVISLRDVNLDMKKVIPLLLCKHLYDQKKVDDPANERYLNLIIDEAHNILSQDSNRESDAWRDYRLETFEEFIKEGRKFGVFLTIASQRPHDISPTIISQLHNYFLHRLVNDLDVRAVENAVAYLDRSSFESLPILPTGACILAGVSAQVPVVVNVSQLPPAAAPNSRTMRVAERWFATVPTPMAERESREVATQPEDTWWDDPPF